MTFQIVHIGKGQTRKVELPDFVDGTVDAPRLPQKLKLGIMYARRNGSMARDFDKAHTNYKPGFLLELGGDQCRYPISDENYLMCGAKAEGSYCQHHHKISVRAKS
jgi:GcrA cell cycle regulator